MRGLDLEKYIGISVTITSTVAIPATTVITITLASTEGMGLPEVADLWSAACGAPGRTALCVAA